MIRDWDGSDLSNGMPIGYGLITWRFYIPAIIGGVLLLYHFFFNIIPSIQSVDMSKISDVYKPDIYNISAIIAMVVCAGFIILVVFYYEKYVSKKDE